MYGVSCLCVLNVCLYVRHIYDIHHTYMIHIRMIYVWCVVFVCAQCMFCVYSCMVCVHSYAMYIYDICMLMEIGVTDVENTFYIEHIL